MASKRNLDKNVQSASAKSNDYDNLEDDNRMDELPIINSQSSATDTTNESKKTSWIWKYFNGDREKQTATCINCKTTLSWKTGRGKGGTGHLARHLAGHKITKDSDGEGGTQGTIDIPTGKNFFFSILAYRIETMKFVIGSSLPFNHCDGWRFTKWIQNVVNPRAIRIPRITLRTSAFKYFKNERDLLGNTLMNLPYKMCLTSDIGVFLDFDIMCVTCHWIDQNWVLQRRIIYFRSIAKYDNIEILEGILACANDYKCLNRISSISFDNASANTVSIEKLKMSIKPDFSEFFHVRCLYHVLQFVAKDGIKVVWDEFILPIRKAVNFVVNSGLRRHEYKKMVEASGKKFKKLILDCETRWNSTYDLLLRAYMYKEEISDFYEKYAPIGEYYVPLTYTNWKCCYELLKFLEPLKDYTEVFSTQSDPNIHLALECVVNLSIHMTKHRNDYVARDMIPNMEDKFLKYFHPIPHAYAIGIILDPHAKLKHFNFYVKLYYESLLPFNPELQSFDLQKWKDGIETYMYNMYSKYQSMYGQGKKTTPSSSIQSFNVPRTGVKIRSRHDHLRNALQALGEIDPIAPQDTNELTQYLTTNFELSQYNDKNPFDILKWWASKEALFPVLSKMAKEIFSIPMSAIASESAFSMAKLQYTQRPSRLTSSAIEVCVCIKDWTAAEHRMQDKDTVMERKEKDMFDDLSDIEEEIEEESDKEESEESNTIDSDKEESED